MEYNATIEKVYKWQLVYLAEITVRCLASMYDIKPSTLLLELNKNEGHIQENMTLIKGCD